jgi:hypothetical protein|tara:strand:- start:38 stop:2116 length:2079 start_codon:yes stop_codon:yes gene_type:complete
MKTDAVSTRSMGLWFLSIFWLLIGVIDAGAAPPEFDKNLFDERFGKLGIFELIQGQNKRISLEDMAIPKEPGDIVKWDVEQKVDSKIRVRVTLDDTGDFIVFNANPDNPDFQEEVSSQAKINLFFQAGKVKIEKVLTVRIKQAFQWIQPQAGELVKDDKSGPQPYIVLWKAVKWSEDLQSKFPKVRLKIGGSTSEGIDEFIDFVDIFSNQFNWFNTSAYEDGRFQLYFETNDQREFSQRSPIFSINNDPPQFSLPSEPIVLNLGRSETLSLTYQKLLKSSEDPKSVDWEVILDKPSLVKMDKSVLDQITFTGQNAGIVVANFTATDLRDPILKNTKSMTFFVNAPVSLQPEKKTVAILKGETEEIRLRVSGGDDHNEIVIWSVQFLEPGIEKSFQELSVEQGLIFTSSSYEVKITEDKKDFNLSITPGRNSRDETLEVTVADFNQGVENSRDSQLIRIAVFDADKGFSIIQPKPNQTIHELSQAAIWWEYLGIESDANITLEIRQTVTGVKGGKLIASNLNVLEKSFVLKRSHLNKGDGYYTFRLQLSPNADLKAIKLDHNVTFMLDVEKPEVTQLAEEVTYNLTDLPHQVDLNQYVDESDEAFIWDEPSIKQEKEYIKVEKIKNDRLRFSVGKDWPDTDQGSRLVGESQVSILVRNTENGPSSALTFSVITENNKPEIDNQKLDQFFGDFH